MCWGLPPAFARLPGAPADRILSEFAAAGKPAAASEKAQSDRLAVFLQRFQGITVRRTQRRREIAESHAANVPH